MTLTTRLDFSFLATGSTTVGNDTAYDPLRKYLQYHWESGTGASQANQLYRISGTIGISTVTVIDLVSSIVLDTFGTALALTKLKALLIVNTHATQPFAVTTSISNGVSAPSVRPGGCVILTAPDATGIAVSAGSDTITLTNGTGSATAYEIAVIGVQ